LPEHPNFSFHHGDVLDAELMKELAAGATHIVHCAAIAGVETVLESPVRTMRVNVIGTYNVLEAAVDTLDTLERFVAFSTREDLTVRGDGSQIRAWCYVDDMVSGVLACLERPEAVGQAFNIGNPRSSVTIYDLALRVKRLTGCSGEIVFAPLGYTDVELRIPNAPKARQLIAWEPKGHLDDGRGRS